MFEGFVIGFSVDIASEGAQRIEQFRVVVQNEDIRTFLRGQDAFGGPRWIGEGDLDRPPVSKVSIIAWAFDGYLRAPGWPHEKLPNGLTLIDIGTVKREP